MRVKISYTVDIEEVERKVAEIISSAVDDIDFANEETMRVRIDLFVRLGNLQIYQRKIKNLKSNQEYWVIHQTKLFQIK